MSEYQYYEFQAIDTPLTRAQMDELRKVSSRARITPSTFVNEYHWGDFKGNPDRWIESYFDAFIYVANWGTRRLMFRLPGDAKAAAALGVGSSVKVRTAGSDTIISLYFQNDSGDWYAEEGEDWLSSLIPLRSDLLSGDYRCLYLGWLTALELGELDDNDLEPPVPPGLGALNEALKSLADFFCISEDLIAAAAEQSAALAPRTLSSEAMAVWVAALPAREKDTIIASLLDGSDRGLGARLRQRAMDETLGSAPGGDGREKNRRSVADLKARAEVLKVEREKREEQARALAKAKRAREEAAQREKHLQSLAGKEESLWKKIDSLIKLTQPKPYDEALETLLDLRDLAAKSGTQEAFAKRTAALYAANTKRPAFAARIRKGGLA